MCCGTSEVSTGSGTIVQSVCNISSGNSFQLMKYSEGCFVCCSIIIIMPCKAPVLNTDSLTSIYFHNKNFSQECLELQISVISLLSPQNSTDYSFLITKLNVSKRWCGGELCNAVKYFTDHISLSV